MVHEFQYPAVMSIKSNIVVIITTAQQGDLSSTDLDAEPDADLATPEVGKNGALNITLVNHAVYT